LPESGLSIGTRCFGDVGDVGNYLNTIASLHSILNTALFFAYYLGMIVGMIGMSGNFALFGWRLLGDRTSLI
jgi:hypothetical protein